jgi:glycosyltransferase involved in cell wall biosynthesis
MHPSAGGPPVVVERLAACGQELGWQATVITTSLLCPDGGEQLASALQDRVEAVILPVDRPRILGLSSKAPEVIGHAVRNADIVHLHTLWHPLNTIARKACLAYRRKYVLSPHGMLDPYSLGVKSLRKRVYLKLREERNLRGSSCLLFTTPLEKELARKSLPWLGEGAVIPLGADTPPSEPQASLAELFNTRFPLAQERRRLIFLGRLHPKKGLERLIDALPTVVKYHPLVLAIIAGSGEPAYVRALQARVDSHGLSKHVLFTGMLQGALKWGALAASELFLLPSHQENFAIAAAEAMHMGLPVILSDKVNLWPFIEKAQCGIVLQDNSIASALGAAINSLLFDDTTRTKMAERGTRFARDNFSWENTSRLTINLYKKVLTNTT